MNGELWLEIPCVHGRTNGHWFDDYADPPTLRTWCIGGSRRRVIIDYEAALQSTATARNGGKPELSISYVRKIIDAAIK